jgi:hypothetical protein
VHEVHNLLKIIFAAAKKCFADWGFALSSSTPPHLSQQSWSYKFATHTSTVENYSSRRTEAVS